MKARLTLEEIVSSQRLPSNVLVDWPDSWPELEVKPTFLKLILSNLISNSVKFHDSDEKRIEVGWRMTAPGRVEVFVRDNGIGIEPRLQHQIFGIFNRLHSHMGAESTGIGLSVARKAARLLGGRLRCESSPGNGSTFFIDLPSGR